jgi:hypothetical protein
MMRLEPQEEQEQEPQEQEPQEPQEPQEEQEPQEQEPLQEQEPQEQEPQEQEPQEQERSRSRSRSKVRCGSEGSPQSSAIRSSLSWLNCVLCTVLHSRWMRHELKTILIGSVPLSFSSSTFIVT